MSIPDQLSLQDLEHMREFLDQMGSGFPPSDRSVGGLCNAHQELADCLREFDRASAVGLIAALETIPNLHGITVRLEVLLHITVSRCAGSKQATHDDLRQWIAFMDASPMAPLEDPNEDVFIGYICTPRGGFRVYPGIFSNADFILERLAYFIGGKGKPPGFSKAYDSVIELLRMSEAIADELSQARYLGGGGPGRDRIPIPADEVIDTHSSSLRFDPERLARLGIDATKLEPFLLTAPRTGDFDAEPLFGSPLEFHPLLPAGDSIIVASPSSLCRAALVHAIEAASGIGGWADSLFGIESAQFLINEILPRLGIRPTRGVTLPAVPASLPPFFPMVGQFDLGMPVLALTMSSPLTKGGDLEEAETFTEEQIDDFTRFVAESCEACESVERFKGGLVIVGLSSEGRPLAIALKELRPHWHLFACGLADWQTLASDKDFNAKRLWYLGLQQELAEASNISIENTAGLLNLYAYWKSNDFALVHPSFDPRNPRNGLVIDGAFSLKLNTELKSIADRHCRRPNDAAEWVILQRQGAGLNPDLSSNLMYVDHAAASTGQLRGCVEFGSSAWWVESNGRPTNPESSSLLFRLWDCVFNWVEYTLPVLSTSTLAPDPGDLRIVLEFPGIDSWRVEDTTQLDSSPVDLTFASDPVHSTIRLTFPCGFLAKFYRADNLAEREIVAAILRGAAEVAGTKLAEPDLQSLVNRVTKNQNTRFFHIVRSSSLESAISGPHSAEPTFVPLEEMARVRTGLAYRVADTPPEQISDATEAQTFLDQAVVKLQASLCARLKKLHILPIVSHSFSQLDELSRDGTRWGLSTRSLLALAEDAAWLQNRLRVESGRLALAEITNRTLIETAVYSHDPTATEYVTQTEHASLLAELAVMIELANHRDAIAGGFVRADLKIHPNGMIDYDETFQTRVFQPYLTTRVDDQIRWNADSYDSNFDPPDQAAASSPANTPALVAFERAFQAEYGFPYETLVKVIDYFDEQAVSKRRAGGTLDSITLRFLLTHQIGLTDKQADGFVDRFTLPIRPAWNRNLPKKCELGDVLPWRFFRGVSLLLRPFVEVSRSPRTFAISAPHLHRWRQYLTNSILSGYLPDRLFHSSAMKSYLGTLANRRGHEFTKDVAEELESLLPHQRLEIKLAELGAPAEPDLGDIDVLTWDGDTGMVFLIECKRLKAALTVRQVIQQLEEFRGDQAEEDSLAKHQRRVDWLKSNPGALEKLTGIRAARIRWGPLLVTSGRVPMSFVDAINFPKNQVIAEPDLKRHIADLLAQAKPPQTLASHPD